MADKENKPDRGGARKQDDLLIRFQYTIEKSSEAIFWIERSGKFSYVNRQACSSLGYTCEELLSMSLWQIDPDYPEERWNTQWEEMKRVRKRIFETRHQRKDGHIFPVEVSACQINFGGGEFHAAFVRDITERKKAREEQEKLEDQLQQAQKLESIGTLAGGIAHDFNNMLSVIIGNSELLKKRLSGDTKTIQNLSEIEQAALRSRDITRQLLAFSRKQVISPVIMNINHQIETTLKMLRRLIGENIDLQFHPAGDIWEISLDPSQLDQILINLIVNARDALPKKGGRIIISTSNKTLDSIDLPWKKDFVSEGCILLRIEDNGSGMTEETLSHVFEPFFTTKELGKGTGLGLATTYGIVKQNDGFIDIKSEPNQGSTFSIYFPRAFREKETAELAEDLAENSGTGKIMLVEDDDMVRRITVKMLEAVGYKVVALSNPLSAISFCETKADNIDLLLTDVVMPEMSGMELSEKIKPLRPGIKVLFMSGYSAISGRNRGVLSKGIQFIEKPFSLNDLALKIEEVLKGP